MMKKSLGWSTRLFSGLWAIMLMTLVGCSAPTDHVGEWTVIEKDGKALSEGTSIEYLFSGNIASKSEIAEENGRLNLSGYDVARSGSELSLTGIDTEGTEIYQVEITKDASGKELMKLTGQNESLLLEKKSEGKPAITDPSYQYLYYPVTVIDDESGMRMTVRFFNNGYLMLDSYQMKYELDAEKGVINVKGQTNTTFQITLVSDKEWEFGLEGAGSSRREVITSKR